MNKEKCLHCGEKVRARNYCITCLTKLYRDKVDFSDTNACLEILRIRDEGKRLGKIKNCIYCGRVAYAKGFCIRHQSLIRYEQCYKDNDVNKCVKLIGLKDPHKIVCIFCGEKQIAKGFCKKHYEYLRRRNYNLDEKQECIEVLELFYERNPNEL